MVGQTAAVFVEEMQSFKDNFTSIMAGESKDDSDDLDDSFNTLTSELDSLSKLVKEQLITDSRRTITNYIEELNNNFDAINDKTALPEDVLSEIYYKDKCPAHYPVLSVKRPDIEDLAKLSWQFSLYDILDAIDFIYMNYTLAHTPIDNFAGLVRTLIPEIRDSRELYKLAA